MIISELSSLFRGELNPVAAKAQQKVPVPMDLDLDKSVNPEAEANAAASTATAGNSCLVLPPFPFLSSFSSLIYGSVSSHTINPKQMQQQLVVPRVVRLCVVISFSFIFALLLASLSLFPVPSRPFLLLFCLRLSFLLSLVAPLQGPDLSLRRRLVSGRYAILIMRSEKTKHLEGMDVVIHHRFWTKRQQGKLNGGLFICLFLFVCFLLSVSSGLCIHLTAGGHECTYCEGSELK